MMKKLFALFALSCLLALFPLCALADGAPYLLDVYNEVEGVVSLTDRVRSDADFTVLESMIPLPGTLWDTALSAAGTIEWHKIAYTENGEARTGFIVANRDVLLEKESLSSAEPMTGFVLCQSLSIRQSASSSARVVASMPYGSYMSVVAWEGEWMRVHWTQDGTHFDGWVRCEYVLVDPPVYTASGDTPVYAYPDGASPRIGLLSRGDAHPIIARIDGYTVISLRGASGFIRE